VFVVDDHPVFRAGLAATVNLEPDLRVCGEAADAGAALTLLANAKADLVLVDMSLPGKSGLELLKDIRVLYPQLPVLMISMHEETVYAERIIRAGGRGYVMKQEGPDKIIQAIRSVLSGHVAVSERMASHLVQSLSGTKIGVAGLTDREFEIYRLIGQGKEPHLIAEALHLSIKTVDTHRGHIKDKLGLKNATELIHHATRWVAEQS
jgi:DNA-binding NarL/FixJ family response regulator